MTDHPNKRSTAPALATTPFTWRIIHFPPVLLLLAIIASGCTGMVATWAARHVPGEPGGPVAIARGALVAAMFVGMFIGFNRWIEHRIPREFSYKGWAVELGGGLLLGGGLFCAVVGVIWLGGGYHIVGYHPAAVLYPIIGISILSGVVEEIMLRGLFFRLVEGWLGSWIALALSAALFGALHLGNDNATPLAGAAIALEAGVMLAALYMVTRRLWAVIGLHAAWNFTQGGVFGIAVSGNVVEGLLRPRISGPNWLTGGPFGAEASLPAVLVCGMAGAVLIGVATRRGRVVAPFWASRP